jgi:hypothetical protein
MYLLLSLRLTPPCIITILITATLARYVGSGPLISAVLDERAENCQNNWWTNLLYINNYVAEDHMVSTIFIMAFVIGLCILLRVILTNK